MQPDPFLLASKMTPDAVLAYHTALEFHGRAYSAFQEFTYLTRTATRPAEFRGNTFRPAAFPKSLLEKNQENFGVEAAATGFRPEMLEKVIHLLGLLEGFTRHPYLKNRIALEGGTALNLFIFDLPRLSVDIDVNYIGAPDRETMLAERPKVEQAIAAVCGRRDFAIQRIPEDHAGGIWRLRYAGRERKESCAILRDWLANR